MAASTASFGANNSGFEAAVIHGSVHTQFNHHHRAPPERRETPPPPTIVIPFNRRTDFIERGTVLDDIRERFESQSRVALVGLGGVGKSQLAIEYAYRTRVQSPATWVFWVHGSNAARFEQSFRDIADQVKISGRKDPAANIFQLVYEWLCDERKGSWLLILDNVDDSQFLVEVSSSTKENQPTVASMETHAGCRDAALELVEQRDALAIGPMSHQEALALLTRKLPGHNDSAMSSELVTALEYMALAIVQAAAYISQRQPRYSVYQYVEDFKKNDRKRSSLLNHVGERLRRDREATNSIIITWQISFEHIREMRPSAADLLSLMSFFDRQGISETLLYRDEDQAHLQQDDTKSSGGRWDVARSDDKDSDLDITFESDSDTDSQGSGERFEQDLITLQNYTLISINNDGKTFEMHRLVQFATREWLKAHKRHEIWNHRFITNLNAELPTGDYENWATCQALFPHAQAALAQKPALKESLIAWAKVLYKAAWYAEDIGNWDKAEEMLMQALKVNTKTLGKDHNDTLNSMANLASTYWKQGRWDAAEELQVQVMEMHKTKLGTDHPDTLRSMNNLASTYHHQGHWDAAEELEVQVMEMNKTKLGTDHSDTLTSMANLASTYWKQGRWDAAEELFVQVMEVRKTKLGVDHPDTLSSMANLASTYSNQGRWDAMVKLLLERGADINAQVKRYGTALYAAVSMGEEAIVKRLFDRVPQTSATLKEAVERKNSIAIETSLENHFHSCATGDYAWLHELKELGYTWKDMAELLLEEAQFAPWIPFDADAYEVAVATTKTHVKGCVHQVLADKFTAPHLEILREVVCKADLDMKRIVHRLCGLAGVCPISNDRSTRNGIIVFAELPKA